MYEVQLWPVHEAEPPPAPPPVPPHADETQAQVPAEAVHAPSAEPVCVPVRQEPLHQPQAFAAVHDAQVVFAAQGSALPPPAPPPVPPAAQTPAWHDSPAQQSADEVQAI